MAASLLGVMFRKGIHSRRSSRDFLQLVASILHKQRLHITGLMHADIAASISRNGHSSIGYRVASLDQWKIALQLILKPISIFSAWTSN